MSISSAHSATFYKEVTELGLLWTIRDENGFPAPLNNEGKRAQPFWSSRGRVEKMISTVSAYAGFTPYELDLHVFMERWIPGLARDEILIGVNWSGDSATGFDVDPAQVAKNILAQQRG